MSDDDHTDYGAADEVEYDPYPDDASAAERELPNRKPLHPEHARPVLNPHGPSPFQHFSQWKREERERQKAELRQHAASLSPQKAAQRSPRSDDPSPPQPSAHALPPLHSRYLEQGLRFRAQRQAAKLQREASHAKSTLQRMFRELDLLEQSERDRENRLQERVHSRLAKPLTEKVRRRLKPMKPAPQKRAATSLY